VNGDYYGRGHLYLYAYEGNGADGTAYVMARDTTDTSTIALQLRTHNAGAIIEALRMNGNGFTGILNTAPGYPLHVGTNGTNGNGAHVTVGGAWVNGSSRTFKEDLRPVEPLDVLEAVEAIPIYRWRYKNSDEGEHMGPVAEDFYQSFRLGDDARYIADLDGDGVALAAIQGLYELVKELQAENRQLIERIEQIEQ